ncbi:Fur family transcriptional regulator [Levilactobacillus bambusae]|uniref:Transcriptional repressor n=1 Tax=Levilactobacillus bambusae TaxID=2024736 RepID=A0A2V1N1A8_9LACO|nr:Fur family transcriptional regulator [Levilactobacillus bambusae]PWG00100.1 transcriptional repressor [Levilactobacillus bambusae]
MSDPDMQAATKILQDNHVRVTAQRRVILNYLMTHHNHPSVEMIATDFQRAGLNLSVATLYNTLNLFVDLGIVIELPSDNGVHYDYFGRPHYHVICENCGKITDVFSPRFPEIERDLEEEAARETGYEISGSHVEVYGLCPDCQAKLN